jgi:hypothetical protein
MSARQKIENALRATPKISLDELQSQLPEIKPVTLKSEFYKLKRKLFGPEKSKKPKNKAHQAAIKMIKKAKQKNAKKKSAQQQVSDYLGKNPGSSFDSLKSAFPDIKKTSLSAYKSLWRKEQPEQIKDVMEVKAETVAKEQLNKNKQKKDELDNAVKPVKEKKLEKPKAKLAEPAKKKDKPVKEKMPDKSVKPSKSAKKDNTELIKSLNKTIAAQEKTIQTMSKTFEQLSPESNGVLKGMMMSEIKRIATTYLKSIKELPAKLR